MRQRFNTRQRNYVILGLCGVLLIMAVGYAAFRSQLTINGTSNISSEWKVLITDIQSSVLNGTPENSEEPSHTDTTATFKTNLVSPGDSMQYTVTVENRGSIDAVLKTLSKTDSNNQAIIFEITGIEQGDTLKAHESTTFNVTVTYNKDVTNQPANLTSDLTITLDYVQAGTTDTGEVLPTETNLMRSYNWNYQNDYHNDNYREKITSIEFLNNKNIPSEAVESWDVSERQDGSVMAWIVNDTENEGFYKLYIGGDGGVVANPDSSTLFSQFINLKTIDLSNLDASHVTDMNYMFDGARKLESINFGSNFDTSNVIDMHAMFSWCTSLKSLDLSMFNTESVTDMNNMFNHCTSLTNINFGGFNTSNVTDMNQMFNYCTSLTKLDLSQFNTSKVTNMNAMFNKCTKLTSLDLSSFNTKNVIYMNEMFGGCESLTELNLSSFNSSSVIDMSAMFCDCTNLTNLNLLNFDTSNVTSMGQMFAGCRSLTSLDVSNFDTSNVTDMSYMFSDASNLQTIYVGSKWSTDGTNTYFMFNNCGTDHVTLKQS